MLSELRDYLEHELEFDSKEKLILAVSGGADSMCLWYLFRELKLNYVLAHCNFGLRGEESDEDEKFIRKRCNEEELLFVKHFDTESYARSNKLSIQMAAREQRYGFFDDLLIQEKAVRVATAHHLDDQIETFFIQLLRNGSLNSLSGIPTLTSNRIRPLMFADRKKIDLYVKENKIPYREDSSNKSNKYLRNRVRNKLLPAISEVDVEIKDKVLSLMNDLEDINFFINKYSEEAQKKIEKEEEGSIKYSINEIKSLDFPELFIEQMMKKHGFNRRNTEMLMSVIDGQSGKVFYSSDKKLIKDRNTLIVRGIDKTDTLEYHMFKDELEQFSALAFDSRVDLVDASFKINSAQDIAQLDYDKLNEHIIFRKWKKGDSFIPLGMKGRMKMSDFFIDHKYSLADKEDQWLMVSGDRICWVVGQRIDDRFKITEKTGQVLTIRLN